MNITRPVLNSLVQDQIDKTNDRCGIGFSFHRRAVIAVQSHEFTCLAELLEDLLHAGCIGAVILFDAIFDSIRRSDDDIDIFA